MKIGKKIFLTNGDMHEIEYGDVFDFDFKSLKGTTFEGSNFGRSVTEEDPDKIIVSIGKGKLGFFEGNVEYIKDEKVISEFSFYEPMFMNYITGKNAFSFLKNEKKEYDLDEKVSMGEVYKIPFDKFKELKYLKSEKLEELKLNNPVGIIIHFFNMKEINPEMYADCITAKVYAFNQNGFVNFDTPEDIEEDKKYCEERNKKYEPRMAIVDYTFSGLSYNVVKYMAEQSMLKNKIGSDYHCEVLKFEDVKNILENKMKNKSKMKP